MLVYNTNILTGRDFLRALCRRWKLVTIIFVMTAAAVSWSALTTPVSYRATAKVLLRRNERPTSLNQFYSRLTQEEEIKSELEIANSRPVLTSVLRVMLAPGDSTEHLGAEFLRMTNLGVDAARLATARDPSPGVPLANAQISLDTMRAFESVDTTHLTPAKALAAPIMIDQLANAQISLDTARAFETLVDEFRSRLTVEAVTGANVIAISFEDPEPWRASWCANAVAKTYAAYNARVYSGEGADEFLNERIQLTRMRLDSLESLLETFRGANAMISVDKQENLLLDKYKSFDLQLAQLLERRQVLAGQIVQFRQMESAGDSIEVPTAEMDAHPAVRQLYGKLTDLRLQRRALLEKYQPGHRLVEEVSQQLRSVQEELSGEIVRLRRLEEERLNALNLEANALSGVVASLHTNMQQLPEKKRTLEDLELVRDQARKLYNVLVTRREELGVESATDRRLSRIAVIDPAGLPVHPVSPPKARTIALGVVLGLFAGIAAALLREFFDRTIKSPQELNSTLEVPVLASISESSQQSNLSPLKNSPSGHLEVRDSIQTKKFSVRTALPNGENKNREQHEYFIR